MLLTCRSCDGNGWWSLTLKSAVSWTLVSVSGREDWTTSLGPCSSEVPWIHIYPHTDEEADILISSALLLLSTCAQHPYKYHLIYFSLLSYHLRIMVATTSPIGSIWQMGKLKLRELDQWTQDHISRKSWDVDLHSGPPGSHLRTPYLVWLSWYWIHIIQIWVGRYQSTKCVGYYKGRHACL